MEKSFTLNKRDFMDDKYAFVMMIKDKWWREFLRLRHKGKQVQSYVQNGWAPPKNTSLLFFMYPNLSAKLQGMRSLLSAKPEMLRAYGRSTVASRFCKLRRNMKSSPGICREFLSSGSKTCKHLPNQYRSTTFLYFLA